MPNKTAFCIFPYRLIRVKARSYQFINQFSYKGQIMKMSQNAERTLMKIRRSCLIILMLTVLGLILIGNGPSKAYAIDITVNITPTIGQTVSNISLLIANVPYYDDVSGVQFGGSITTIDFVPTTLDPSTTTASFTAQAPNSLNLGASTISTNDAAARESGTWGLAATYSRTNPDTGFTEDGLTFSMNVAMSGLGEPLANFISRAWSGEPVDENTLEGYIRAAWNRDNPNDLIGVWNTQLYQSMGMPLQPFGSGNLVDFSGATIVADVTYTYTFAPVPEPATMLLLGLGMVGLAGVRRFKK
jgi:hypothetical protein